MGSIKLSDTMQSVYFRIINHDSTIDRNKKVDFWVDSFGDDIVNFSSNIKDDDNCIRIIRLQRKIRCNLNQKTKNDFCEYLRRSFPDMSYLYETGTLSLDLIGDVFKDEDYYDLIKGGLYALDVVAKKAIELVEK